MTIFSIPAASLSIVSTAGGCNLLVPNADSSQFTLFLTFDQARALGQAAGFLLATSELTALEAAVASPLISSEIIDGIISLSRSWVAYPQLAMNLSLPVVGGTYATVLTSAQMQLLFTSLSQYSVTAR